MIYYVFDIDSLIGSVSNVLKVDTHNKYLKCPPFATIHSCTRRIMDCRTLSNTPRRCRMVSPSDFYLWGHLKQLVYAADIPNVETLHQRVIAACESIRHRLEVFERVRQSMIRRVHACVAANGRHFEHLWVYVLRTINILSLITKKQSVFGHMFIWTFFLVLVSGTYPRSL